ncbi:palmitoyltransferase ZDHHC16A isoform X2 [Dermacentor silvarum]|uniref:palmitoyltransferase ZDHHC16A isoform X2 n=1 Tax=Dermacentor silvarum TaxID=543639 RepID=UPI00189BBBFA|nr:palmitoyltransferase ZDHHC16A isoform X2 [Dermacentor silvarum]
MKRASASFLGVLVFFTQHMRQASPMDVLVRLTRYFRRVSERFRARVRHRLHYSRIVFNSLVYNEFADIYYAGDTCMEPLFWIVDHFTKAMGPIFVTTVTIVACTVIVIAYMIGIPYWWENNKCVLLVALVIGHWLLINIVFHYWMALTTNPGTPPEASLVPEVVSICKKCIAPKPPRTHHCSVCNRCILKMDHHCPWLNNCIGHFTHRYFFMFCSYVLIGIIYLMIFGYRIAYEEYFCTLPMPAVGLASSKIQLGNLDMSVNVTLQDTPGIYRNPYDFGPRKNWRIFLGLTNGRTWRHLLLPSAHLPEGNGLTWTTIYSERW